MLELEFVIMVATIFVCCWTIEEVMSVIEMVVDEKDDREVHRVGMVVRVTKVWRKAKSAEAGICIRFSCRENIIQIKLETGPNLKQDFDYRRLSFIKIKFGRRQRLPISLRSG